MSLFYRILIFFSFFFHESISQLVYVNTSRGRLVGKHIDLGSNKSKLYYGSADIFLGISFMQPPIGNLRFQKPQPIAKFSGETTYNATFYRPACPQPFFDSIRVAISEDCLYLNIFTPKANSSTKYPVMIWIHGGSNFMGHAQEYGYKGAIRNLVSRGVVVVTIQYRLGMLGFFTTMTNDFPANLAMYDQIMAINFVRQEIGNFGGDPNKITLFGNSAGGSDVSAHTYSPMSQNLFHQAIMESGVAQVMIATDNNMSFDRAKTLCNYTKKMWNSKNFTALKKCLQSMDYQRFLALDNFNVDWNMVVGDDFLPDYPENLWKKRKNIPVIIGTNKDEYAYDEMINLSSGDTKISDYDKAFFKNLLNTDFEYTDPELSQIANYLEKVYNDNKTVSDTDHVGWFRTVANALTGALYTANARTEAKYYLQNNNSNVYLYEFAYFTKIGQVYDFGNAYEPVEHAKELYFIWMQDWEWSDDVNNGIVTPQDYAVADLMGATWTNFAKFGAPFVNQSWTPSKQATFDYFVINPKPEMKQNYRQFDDYVWNYVIPGYLNGDVNL